MGCNEVGTVDCLRGKSIKELMANMNMFDEYNSEWIYTLFENHSVLTCSPNIITNSESRNPDFHDFFDFFVRNNLIGLKVRENPWFLVLELIVGSGKQDIGYDKIKNLWNSKTDINILFTGQFV